MVVTRSDVARAAGVSPAVVSYVLNNGPRPVSTDLRARVEEAVSRLGYRPNAIAAALRAGTTQSIGFLVPNPRNPFFAELAEAVERNFSERGYLVLTANTYYDRGREERYLRTFIDRNVDGLIFGAGVTLVASPLPSVAQPVLVLDAPNGQRGWSSIATEDAEDAAMAVEHLQRHGHSLIGCIAGPPHVATEAARIAGWVRQQDSVDLPSGSELVAYAEISEEGGNAAALQLLSQHGRPWAVHGRRPTALFVASDAQAVGAIHACYELGLRVPDDIAIVSMGGTRAAGYTIPPLTTLRQDVEYIAGTAAVHLLHRVSDSSTPPLHARLRGNLVVGRSCGC
ncbi:MAG: LacI family transcriptional regulator [Microbacteriaceae bacterium]|nr:LacI family transcriptional regulator [Microbacteriaceae bacterium]